MLHGLLKNALACHGSSVHCCYPTVQKVSFLFSFIAGTLDFGILFVRMIMKSETFCLNVWWQPANRLPARAEKNLLSKVRIWQRNQWNP